MLIICLFVHIQDCVVRYQTRRALARLTAQQMTDIGMTKEHQRAELLQASVFGFVRDLMNRKKKEERALAP
ncbi:DUF1127 domain-containing protein [Marinomonas sp. IMCC 4694]|uniref:DUF1127 domain-containing protein n=1 Tax=Marinomonas sp. IMCC 4694 TaxID=2605432 RepID=UPI0016532A80|nr:DUF1127 domain-containing protein [Marinomonas sp. IMCC 4694]